jgi:hypothetical protein
VTKLLRVVTPEGQKGDIGRRNGVIAQGARLVSAIADGGNVFEFVSRATVRFLLIEGLDILGGGREGHGIGLAALNGCTLLSTVDSRTTMNRHPASTRGGSGIYLQSFGTLIGGTAYSMFNQKRLIDAYVVGQLVMIGCAGSGRCPAPRVPASPASTAREGARHHREPKRRH